MIISPDVDTDNGDDDDNYYYNDDDSDDDNELDDEDQIYNNSANFQAWSSIFCIVINHNCQYLLVL